MIKEIIKKKIENFSLKKQEKHEFKSSKKDKKQKMLKIKHLSDLKLEFISISQVEEIVNMLNVIEKNIDSLTIDKIDEYSIKLIKYFNRLQHVIVIGKDNKVFLSQMFCRIITKLYFRKLELNEEQFSQSSELVSKQYVKQV